MREILNNLTRRKLRTGLTILGITIGVLALTTMGSLAEKSNSLIDGGVRFFSDHVTVSAATNGGFGGIVQTSKVDDILLVDGVQAACATTGGNVKTDLDLSISFGASDTVVAEQPGCLRYSHFKFTYASGHEIDPLGTGQVALGSDITREFKKKVGDTIELPQPPKKFNPDFVSHHFTIVGILDKTGTAPDSFAFVSFQDGQRLFGDALPAALKGHVDATKIATGIDVYGKPGRNLDALANRINDKVAGVRAIPPTSLVNAFKAASLVLTGITTGSALLALVIGGLSVINTMLMAVTERVREIGLKKAVGARTRHILREFITEATVIGAIGGGLGLALGWTLTTVINTLMVNNNQAGLFELTLRLAVVSLVFAILLGTLAGVIPALRAARLDPVTALRSQ
ncbi:MAG: ABC transporter permease [Candidatus Dormibacteraceae bacterium]